MASNLTRVKAHPNLYTDDHSGSFVFRKYSSLKQKEFSRVTERQDSPAQAYKSGVNAFNEWLNKDADESGTVYFSRFARKILNAKLDDPKLSAKTKATFRNQLEPSPRSKDKSPRSRLIDAFGHLPIEKVTKERWKAWTNLLLKEYPDYKFFNAKKAMVEILTAAQEAGHIKKLPELEIADSEAAPPVYLEREKIIRILKHCHSVRLVRIGKGKTGPMPRSDGFPGFERKRSLTKLLAFIMWKQGARPGEILQYEYAMFDFRAGTLSIPGRLTKTRRARVIPANPKVLRIVRFLSQTSLSPFLFPSPAHSDRPMGEYSTGWGGACKRAGEQANVYWLRDTFVTDKFEQGISSIFIAKYIDTSAEMLEKKYAVAKKDVMQRVAGGK